MAKIISVSPITIYNRNRAKKKKMGPSKKERHLCYQIMIFFFNQWIFQVPVKGGRDYITP